MILQIENLTKKIKGVTVLDNINLTLTGGTCSSTSLISSSVTLELIEASTFRFLKAEYSGIKAGFSIRTPILGGKE